MRINAKVLDSREDGGNRCYLCRITLENYVGGLTETYQGYDLQREIVSNVYLDRLVDTVLQKRHIPPIVLVVEAGRFTTKGEHLEIEEFKILDGLQRTFRLQAIKRTIDFVLNDLEDPRIFLTWNKFKFSRNFSSDMRDLNSNTEILRSILESYSSLGAEGLSNTFTRNGQWFEIWTGLTPDDEVQKMLTLNAGHKPVKTRHQLELLFLNLLPVLRSGKGTDFKLVREKEVSSTQFSKGRICGSFHFAHIIAALLSFFDGKPIITSTGLIQELQNQDNSFEQYRELLSSEFLKAFVVFLVDLDKLLTAHYGELGTLWMGREVSLAGLFGALGAVAEANNLVSGREAVMQELLDILKKRPAILNLRQFEEVRNHLDLSKVNLGNANRMAVYKAVKTVLTASPKTLEWNSFFQTEGR